MTKYSLLKALFILAILGACTTEEPETDSNITQTSTETEKPNWVNFPHDSVVIYVYNILIEDAYQPIIYHDSLHLTAVFNFKLDSTSTDQLSNILGWTPEGSDDGERSASDCFMPHHGIVFYHEGKPQHYYSICFLCNGIKTRGKPTLIDPTQLVPFFKEMDIPFVPNEQAAIEYIDRNASDPESLKAYLYALDD